MVERVRERDKEPEPKEDLTEAWMKFAKEKNLKKQRGKVIIKGKDIPWYQSRQALSQTYLHPGNWDEVACPNWRIGHSRTVRQTGKHKHRGGGHYIFVVEGRGYTINNEVRHDWGKGDLMFMALNPDGNEHRHFNLDPSQPTEFITFFFYPFFEAVGYELEQKEDSPDYKKIAP